MNGIAVERLSSREVVGLLRSSPHEILLLVKRINTVDPNYYPTSSPYIGLWVIQVFMLLFDPFLYRVRRRNVSYFGGYDELIDKHGVIGSNIWFHVGEKAPKDYVSFYSFRNAKQM